MKGLKGKFAAVSTMTVLLGSTMVSHAVTYDVTNAASTRCGAHGLWTNSRYETRCDNYFGLSGQLSIDDSDTDSSQWTGALNATAINADGIAATINLLLGDWVSDWSYKRERGAKYDEENVDFFTSISGTIQFADSGEMFTIDGFKGPFAFQYGSGASAKDPVFFGASAWITDCNKLNAEDCLTDTSSHWDLNLQLSSPVRTVPLPSSLVLFGSALIGLGLVKRRRSRGSE